jgi:hypothetical protein
LRAIIRRAHFGGREIRPLEVGIDDGIPILLGLVDRELFNRDAGIVDEHADRAKCCFRAVDRFPDRS